VSRVEFPSFLDHSSPRIVRERLHKSNHSRGLDGFQASFGQLFHRTTALGDSASFGVFPPPLFYTSPRARVNGRCLGTLLILHPAKSLVEEVPSRRVLDPFFFPKCLERFDAWIPVFQSQPIPHFSRCPRCEFCLFTLKVPLLPFMIQRGFFAARVLRVFYRFGLLYIQPSPPFPVRMILQGCRRCFSPFLC